MEQYYDESIDDMVICAGPTPWIVTDVRAKEDFELVVSFKDGSTKKVDMKPLLDKPIFLPLKNPRLFAKAHVDYDTVIWNDDIDIAPEYLYEQGESI